jgi:CheY-like chemotaxis protein
MTASPSPDDRQVLVVAQSRVNLVIISEIVHRCGLRSATESVVGAAARLKANRPRLVILDGGADNRDCDGIFEEIEALRRISETGSPRVIMLYTRSGPAERPELPSCVDEAVAKPITPERLQPVIDRLARRKD